MVCFLSVINAFVLTGMWIYSVLMGASLAILVYVMFFMTDENIFTTLNKNFENAKALITAAKDVNTVVEIVKDGSKLVVTAKNGSTLVTTGKNGSTLVTTAKNGSTLVTTVKNGSTAKNGSTLVTTAKDANTPITTIENTKMPFTTIENLYNSKSTVTSLRNSRFAIVYNYWEQQTNAIINMWSLQMWANFVGFKVLEPFAYQSTLALTDQILYHYNFTNVLSFRDYFDLDYWTKKTKEKHGIPPLEKWDTFALSPLKKTVVVILAYNVFPVGEYVGDDINKHRDCVEQKNQFYNLHAKLFDRLQIQVVKNVCFVFNYKANSAITLNQFNSLILPDNDVNVWFSVWRGIQYDRIPISDHHELNRGYAGEENILGMMRTSPRVLKDSRKYVNTVLNVDFKEYTAVAFRTGNRRTALVKDGYSRRQVIQYFHECAEEVRYALLEVPLSAKFLSIDMGRFGDLTAAYEYFKVNDEGTKLLKFILKKIYGNKSIDDYENELIRAANGIEDSGYIGSMQKTIAENAKHLIVVGGYSSFQRSMIATFMKTNKNCQECVTYICYYNNVS